LGHEKVLEVRKFYNDFTMLVEFFTEDFCNKYEFFEWKHYPNGEYKIESRDYKKIKDKLIRRHINGGLPEIRLVDPNFANRGEMMLEHSWEGRTLDPKYAIAALQSLYYLWGHVIHLSIRNKDGAEIVFSCYGADDDNIQALTRMQFEKDEE
jgi:stage V sporulation protein R